MNPLYGDFDQTCTKAKQNIDHGIQVIQDAVQNINALQQQGIQKFKQDLEEKLQLIDQYHQCNQESRFKIDEIKKHISQAYELNHQMKQDFVKLQSDNEVYKAMKIRLFSSFGENLADTARANMSPNPPYTVHYSPSKSPVNWSPVSPHSQDHEGMQDFSPSYSHVSRKMSPVGHASRNMSPVEIQSPQMGKESPPRDQDEARQLFQEMRSVIPVRMFNQFLASVQLLNNRKIPKELVLQDIQQLLGSDHAEFASRFANLIQNKSD